MSLRARLILGLVLLAALGLVLAGSITYAEQRSFLLERVDDQARAAAPALARELSEQGVTGLPGGSGGPGFGRGGRGPGGRGGGPPRVNLPPGTYGELRDSGGRIVGTPVTVSFGQQAFPPPRTTDAEPGRLTTVDAESGGLEYRVLAEAIPAGTFYVAVPMSDVDETLDRLLLVEFLVILGVLIALGGFAFVIVRVGLRPLDRMGETAGAIAAGDLSRRVSPADERTEVGRLGLSLNRMLERLESAFSAQEASERKLRTFLADASHELRTPLASIRGYAELFRMGAARDTADTEKAMRRIEEEAARMGVLVEDLLTLARLDELRDPVREPVDLARLAEDAAGDARATDPARDIRVDAGPASVLGDSMQLRQVLANLLRNALTHTPAGTPIDIAVRPGEEEGGRVVLEVRDHGHGLPDGDQHVLFERFWRSEGGRKQGRAGAGLGLAIVAAIVDAHQGRVSADNAPGGGARFRVELPAA
jgi:two-component system OmpR family sensor kinase